MAPPESRLRPGAVTLADLRALWARPHALRVEPSARSPVDAAAAVVADVVAAHETVYGVNTGFGLLARTRIDDARLAELQRALEQEARRLLELTTTKSETPDRPKAEGRRSHTTEDVRP